MKLDALLLKQMINKLVMQQQCLGVWLDSEIRFRKYINFIINIKGTESYFRHCGVCCLLDAKIWYVIL